MAEPLADLKKRAGDDWLIGYDSRQLIQLTEQLYLELTQSPRSTLPKILLAESDPVQFLAGFIAATTAGCPVFLGNPNWVKAEWQQVLDLVQPDLFWGQGDKKDLVVWPQPQNPNLNPKSSSTAAHWRSLSAGLSAIQNRIMIPTGGSSGQMRFAVHTWETLMASVRGFQQHFQLNRVNSFCVLPLYHVSGLMQFMRSFTTGGKLAIQSFNALETAEKCDIAPAEFFISLVPTQLQRLLQKPNLTTWLSQFQTALLGGAPAWSELLEEARYHRIHVALTYGMTETASQIVTLKPRDFLRGDNSCGQVLPHAKVTIHAASGEILGPNKVGTIKIQADSLALGYYPDFANQQYFQVDDLGFFDEQGYLNIVGRSSHKIITGGENVFPTEVEAVIRSTNLVTDICVIGLPDCHWGQAVTAVYVPRSSGVSKEKLKTALADKLSKFKCPKHWLSVASLPRNSQGKVNYVQLEQLAIASLPDH